MSYGVPEVCELEPRNVAYVSYVGNYMGNVAIFEELFGKLCAWAGPQGLLDAGAKFSASYQDDPQTTPPEELRLELCLEVPEGTVGEGEVGIKILPGGKYVVLHAEISKPEEYGLTWEWVVQWLSENNLEIDMSRPSYEMYLNNPNEHPEGLQILDICVSAK